MGFLSRLFAPPAPAPRVEPRVATERRYADGWLDNGWDAMALGGGRGPVAPHLAESLSSVLGSVELISGSIASLPPTLTIEGDAGQLPAPLTATGWALLRRPNPRQSWPSFWTCMTASMLLQGNAVAWLQRDGRGAVVSLVPIPWPWLLLSIVQGGAGPRLVYDLVQATPETMLLGLPRRLLDSDVLHIRNRSDDGGLIGRSVLSRAAGVVREGVELGATAESLFRNGLSLSGFLETGGAVLTEPQRDRFKASLAEFRGPGNAGKTMLLEGPFKYNPLSVTPADAELLASRAFSVGEVARLFCIPEPLVLIGQRAPGSLDPYLAAFAILALQPIVNAIETEFAYAVLPPGMCLQLDLAGLMRGSFSGQVAAFAVATQSGITTPNDARRGLGLPAHADGDALRPAGVPSWPADAKGMPHLGPSPGHTGSGLPEPGNNANNGAG